LHSQSDELRVFVLMHTEDDDSVERWVLNRVVHLGQELAWTFETDWKLTVCWFLQWATPMTFLFWQLGMAMRIWHVATLAIYHDPQTQAGSCLYVKLKKFWQSRSSIHDGVLTFITS